MALEPLRNGDTSTAVDWFVANRVRLLKFGGVGVSGVVVNLAIFTVSFHFLFGSVLSGDLKFVLANAAGFVVSVFTNFLLNDLWTWGDRLKGGIRHWFHRLGKYYVTASSAGAVQIFTAWLTLNWLWEPLALTAGDHDLSPTLGVLTGIACGTVINFAASHLWAFRDARSPR